MGAGAGRSIATSKGDQTKRQAGRFRTPGPSPPWRAKVRAGGGSKVLGSAAEDPSQVPMGGFKLNPTRSKVAPKLPLALPPPQSQEPQEKLHHQRIPGRSTYRKHLSSLPSPQREHPAGTERPDGHLQAFQIFFAVSAGSSAIRRNNVFKAHRVLGLLGYFNKPDSADRYESLCF